MKIMHHPPLRVAGFSAALLATALTAQAQNAYGVDALGGLFRFDLTQPNTIYSIGNLGFTPEAIDFRPGTSTLYAFDVNGSTATIYTVDTATGAATAVGSGFATSGTTPAAYNFSGATSFAFDFNPTTLQGDGSIRIRLVGNDGSNLRLNSNTGGIAAVDGAINGVPGALVSGAAYTNSDVAVTAGNGTTALYYIDYANNNLLLSPDPNLGAVTLVGSLGADVGANLGFDIYSGGSADTGYIVDTTGGGVANYYSVDLGTGQTTLLGTILRDFTGGFAIEQLAAIPEPSIYAVLAGTATLGLVAWRRRRSARAIS